MINAVTRENYIDALLDHDEGPCFCHSTRFWDTSCRSSCIMLHFQPQYASPRLRSSTSNASSGHELSAVVAPELQNLTADDVDILGAVIQRAGPSATTFFTVFKAYSDVLRERGLDPQEVVYYGKLLKLGTMKGRNWGEKWEMVRTQRNYVRYSLIPVFSIKLKAILACCNFSFRRDVRLGCRNPALTTGALG